VALILSLKRLKLDRAGLTSLDGIEVCSDAAHVELQHNAISDLTPLELIFDLLSLNAGHNRIERVSGISSLLRLSHVNLEHNLIATLAPGEFPVALRSLTLRGNPVADLPHYHQLVRAACPFLRELDGEEFDFDIDEPVGEVSDADATSEASITPPSRRAASSAPLEPPTLTPGHQARVDALFAEFEEDLALKLTKLRAASHARTDGVQHRRLRDVLDPSPIVETAPSVADGTAEHVASAPTDQSP
jgi:hypothetical protein